ncbi:MAG: hypothetical protein LBJ74_05310 [Heliobacteriaceae bacterium]|jgi:hypothetical protein|nr:hypothetical protein [Heliobacteriaceae bacterium]
MNKSIFIFIFLLALPVMAEEIQFSGAVNQAHPQYPALYQEKSYDEGTKPVAREIKKNPAGEKRAPMTYGNFPQNYDSSNNMMLMQQMQGGMGVMGY